MGGMQFNALVNGHTIVMDAPERSGGQDLGPIPKPLLLAALTGCSGMDVAALLRKAGKEVKNFSMKAEGEVSKQAPVQYTAIHLVYEIEGDPSVEADALNAVRLSQEKYCGVSDMLKKILPLSWEVRYNGETIFEQKAEQELAI